MGVPARGDHIVARFQFIALEIVIVRVVPVEGRHILRDELKRNDIALAGLQQIGLCESAEVCGRLLYPALGVRRGVIHLHDVLTGNVADVGDLHLHGDRLLFGSDVLIRRNARKLPFEICIGQAVAERIQHLIVIPGIARAGGLGVLVVIARFVITVVAVNAFAVFDVDVFRHVAVGIAEEGIHAIAVCILVLGVLAEVGPVRSFGEILFPRAYGVSGGIHRTVDDASGGHGSGVTHAADPEDRVHAEVIRGFLLVKFGYLHYVGRVDYYDNLIEILLYMPYEIDFVVVELQIMIVVVAVAGHGMREQVGVFRADSGQHHYRRVIVAGICIRDGAAVLVDIRVEVIAGRDFAARGNVMLVHFDGLGVHDKAFAFETGLPVKAGSVGIVGRFLAGSARADAADGEADGGHTEHRYAVFVLSQRQHGLIVAVLEEHLTFLAHLYVQFLGGALRVLGSSVIGIEFAFGVEVARNRSGGRHRRFIDILYYQRLVRIGLGTGTLSAVALIAFVTFVALISLVPLGTGRGNAGIFAVYEPVAVFAYVRRAFRSARGH